MIAGIITIKAGQLTQAIDIIIADAYNAIPIAILT